MVGGRQWVNASAGSPLLTWWVPFLTPRFQLLALLLVMAATAELSQREPRSEGLAALGTGMASPVEVPKRVQLHNVISVLKLNILCRSWEANCVSVTAPGAGRHACAAGSTP